MKKTQSKNVAKAKSTAKTAKARRSRAKALPEAKLNVFGDEGWSKIVESDTEADKLVRAAITEATGKAFPADDMRALDPDFADQWKKTRAAIRPGEMTRSRAKQLAFDVFSFGEDVEPTREAIFRAMHYLALDVDVHFTCDPWTRWDAILARSAKWEEAFAAFGLENVQKAGRYTLGEESYLFEVELARRGFCGALDNVINGRVRVAEAVPLAASLKTAFERYVEKIKKNRSQDFSRDFETLADKLSGLVATMKNGTPSRAPTFDADGNLDAETLQRARLQIEREALEKDVPKITCLKLYRDLKKSLKPGAALDTLFDQHADTWKAAFPKVKTKSSLRVELGKLGECFPDPEKTKAKKTRNAASRCK